MSNMIPDYFSEPEPSSHNIDMYDLSQENRPQSVPDYAHALDNLVPQFNIKLKKRVTFSPDTVNYERESKPYKYHNLFRLAQMGMILKNPDVNLEGSAFLKNVSLRKQRTLAADFTGNSDQLKQKLAKLAGFLDPNLFEHEYLKFTHARKTREYMEKTNGPAATRAERLYILMDELKIAHEFYNQLRTTSYRDRFLVDELITRHIMALDLALTEGYLGVALEVTHTMYDTTRFMLPLYIHIYYNLDGSKINLPFGVIGETGEVENYVNMVSPVISILNRISSTRPRGDNRFFSKETLLTKLQLEMLVLTLCPIRSVMFRAILELVPDTALAAYDALYNCHDEPMRWANNSALRNDYEMILLNLGYADKLGCKGVNFTMISFAARSKTQNKENGYANTISTVLVSPSSQCSKNPNLNGNGNSNETVNGKPNSFSADQ